MTMPSNRRWLMLVLSVLAQTASAFFVYGPAFLIPLLHRDGMSLTHAGWLAAMPMVGVMLTLVAWGAVVDRVGERRVVVVGLLLSGVSAAGAAMSPEGLALSGWLVLGGMTAASTNAASGRIVVGWFPQHRRGLAMGIRQMADPLGVGLAALTVFPVASRSGVTAAFWMPAVMAGTVAALCLVLLKDPGRPSRAHVAAAGQLANPYRGSSFLWRIHAVSVLLVVPQFTVWTYTLLWLVSRRGWSAAAAGALVACTQILGALGRIGAGQLSDRVGSRTRPIRWIALAAATTMAVLALTDQFDLSLSVAVVVVASVVTVADNGLAFTSVAEASGPFWAGRALGTQNTAQFLAAALVPPAMGTVITVAGFPVTFAAAALCPLLALRLVPRKDRVSH